MITWPEVHEWVNRFEAFRWQPYRFSARAGTDPLFQTLFLTIERSPVEKPEDTLTDMSAGLSEG